MSNPVEQKYRNKPMLSLVPIILLGIILILLTAACGPVPMYTVDNAEYVSVNGKVTLEQAKNAIINAATKWQIEEITPGHMTAKLFADQKKVEVDIKYNTKAFSIIYKNSKNLEYDGLRIHANYNKWIQELQHNINTQFDNL